MFEQENTKHSPARNRKPKLTVYASWLTSHWTDLNFQAIRHTVQHWKLYVWP